MTAPTNLLGPCRSLFVRALLFDFDGTLWNPEPYILQAHQEIFLAFGQSLTRDVWSVELGGIDFDIWGHLEALVGRPVDRRWLMIRLNRRLAELLSVLRVRQGVADCLHVADCRGISRGIVSNSSRDWIARYLRQCGIEKGWQVVECADGDLSRAKPNPGLYTSALQKMNVSPREAVAFEDSACGIRAAKRAGIRCVAVRNGVSAESDLQEADLVIDSFERMSVDQVLTRIGGNRRE